jgi:hypothetical protein
MRTGSDGINLGLTNTVLEVPENRIYELGSLYISNVDVLDHSASVYVKKGGTGNSFFLIKNALIKTQSALQVISKEVFLEANDILYVDVSSANKCDCVVSYKEKHQY